MDFDSIKSKKNIYLISEIIKNSVFKTFNRFGIILFNLTMMVKLGYIQNKK